MAFGGETRAMHVFIDLGEDKGYSTVIDLARQPPQILRISSR